jgi:hypothetical protein
MISSFAFVSDIPLTSDLYFAYVSSDNPVALFFIESLLDTLFKSPSSSL